MFERKHALVQQLWHLEWSRQVKHPIRSFLLGPKYTYSARRLRLSEDITDGFGKGLVFLAAGSFWTQAYDAWELAIAVVTLAIVVYDFGSYFVHRRR